MATRNISSLEPDVSGTNETVGKGKTKKYTIILHSTLQIVCVRFAVYSFVLLGINIREANPPSVRSTAVVRKSRGGEYYGLKLLYPELPWNDSALRGENPLSVEVYLAALGSDPKVGIIQPKTDCDGSWQLIRTWLQTCKDSHPVCAKRHMERILPTRLISIGTANDELKVVPSQILSSDIQYLTLSHCWGKAFTTLRRDNYSDLLTNLPEVELSKTFREAIYATRKLGFQYLWIDSLCIIQGDEKDWQREAALMGNVYSNSALNLAAADAPDGDTADTTTHCILGTRAWTFQEKFLPPRIIYFGRTQIGWQCRTIQAHELFPESVYDRGDIGSIHHLLEQEIDVDIALTWYRVIAGYSGRSLTYARDKLVAISGVARLLAPRFGTRYLAGLWEKNMAAQLMWFSYHHPEQSHLDVTSRAPSWSWASTDNRVNVADCVRLRLYTILAEVVEAETTFPNDQFGEVSGRYVHLRCPVIFKGTLDPAFKILDWELEAWVAGKIDIPGHKPATWLIYPDRQISEFDNSLYIVPILESSDVNGILRVWGLIFTLAGHRAFRRVGAFEINDNEDIQEIRKVISEKKSVEIDQSLCVDQVAIPATDGQGGQVIEIV